MKTENSYSFMLPLFKGCVVGGIATAIVSPLLGWTNLVMAARKANPLNQPNINIWRLGLTPKVFYGTTTYATSVAPVAAVAMGAESIILQHVPNTDGAKFAAGLTAGFFSGVVSTPFEMIAQTKTLEPTLTKRQIVQHAIRANGLMAPMRGTGILGVREGLWFTAYNQMPVILGCYFQSFGLEPDQAEYAAAFSAGGICGFMTAPSNVLRFLKQSNVTNPSQNKGYVELAKEAIDALPKELGLSRYRFFFNAGVPRTTAAAAAAILFHGGKKAFDEVIGRRFSE